MKVLADAIKRTETYEYMLWLTSGLAQPSFQVGFFIYLFFFFRLTLSDQSKFSHSTDNE